MQSIYQSSKQAINQSSSKSINQSINHYNRLSNQSLYSGIGGVRSTRGVDSEPDGQRQHPIRQQVRGEEIQTCHSGMRTSTGSSNTQCWRQHGDWGTGRVIIR